MSGLLLRSRRVLARLALLSSLAVLGTGCGGGAEPADEGAPADTTATAERTGVAPCELLTASDIESATGVAPAAAEPDPAEPMCNWPASDGSEDQVVHLIVTDAPAADYEEYVANARAEWGDGWDEAEFRRNFQPVDGPGDFAVWIPYADDWGALQVFAEGRMIQVTSHAAASGTSAREVAAALATDVMQRL